jgi:3-isopropylmalate/(R)-2-methylmalate dehydratase small subunit
MEPFRVLTGLVAPLDRANVDTDAIIPKQFLKSIKRSGFGPNLFDEWRYLDHGEPGMDHSKRPVNPDFVLNQPRYQGATVLLARENFGCGSSREHAPQAIRRRGIRAIVGESYSEIFFGNSVALGLPCVTAVPEAVDALIQMVTRDPAVEVTVNLQDLQVTAGTYRFTIDMPAAARDGFLDGSWDATGLLLDRYEEVEAVAARLPYVGR